MDDVIRYGSVETIRSKEFYLGSMDSEKQLSDAFSINASNYNTSVILAEISKLGLSSFNFTDSKEVSNLKV